MTLLITLNGRVRNANLYINGIVFTFLIILPILLLFKTQLITFEILMILFYLNLFIQPVLFFFNIYFLIEGNKFHRFFLILENIMILGFFIMIALLQGIIFSFLLFELVVLWRIYGESIRTLVIKDKLFLAVHSCIRGDPFNPIMRIEKVATNARMNSQYCC